MNLRFNGSVTEVCRRLIQSHFNEEGYQAMDVSDQEGGKANNDSSGCSEQEGPALAEILIKVLHLPNVELQLTSAQLLFDMHKRENILFSNALESYLSTEASYDIHNSLVRLGALSDRNKLLVKMHTGKLQRLKPKLKQRLQNISSACLLKDDPAEPDTCYQGITYSSREIPVMYVC